MAAAMGLAAGLCVPQRNRSKSMLFYPARANPQEDVFRSACVCLGGERAHPAPGAFGEQHAGDLSALMEAGGRWADRDRRGMLEWWQACLFLKGRLNYLANSVISESGKRSKHELAVLMELTGGHMAIRLG
jgi:hypothetical protein